MNQLRPVGIPAQFDRSAQRRKSMIAKIHVARKQLAMDEDDYRQLLFDQTRRESLTQCSDEELERVIARLTRLGFKPLPAKFGQPPAQHPMARKARALWISLYHLGVVRNSSEAALEAFAKRQLKCERLVWARQSDGYKLIEALKKMAENAGWRQAADPVTGKGRTKGSRGKPNKGLHPMYLQRGLCEAIVERLKEVQVVPGHWSLADTAWRLCGMELPDQLTIPGEQGEAYAALATALGRKLREAAPTLATAEDDAS